MAHYNQIENIFVSKKRKYVLSDIKDVNQVANIIVSQKLIFYRHRIYSCGWVQNWSIREINKNLQHFKEVINIVEK